jgi:hypothetical protein
MRTYKNTFLGAQLFRLALYDRFTLNEVEYYQISGEM